MQFDESGGFEMEKNKEEHVDAYKLLFEAMLKGGIDLIIKAGSKMFESPIALTDENYRLISQFPHNPIGDSIWDTLIREQTLPLETIWTYQEIFLEGKGHAYKPFYANWGPVTNVPRIFGEVHNGECLFGHIAIFLGNRPLCEGDLELTQLLINAINIEIRNRIGQGSLQGSPSTYLKDMLSKGASTGVKNLAERNLRKLVLGDLALLVTPIGESAANKAFANCAVTELSLRYRSTISVIHEDSIVTLIGEIDSASFRPSDHTFIKRIASFLAEHRLVSGISDSFNAFYEIPNRYKQALLTAKLAMKEDEIYLGEYRNYAPMHLFLALLETDSPEIYTHPVLERILQYDHLHKTEYYKTLRTYCLTMQNKESTSVQLSIHRNTLLYRLNRISDLFDVSYEAEQTALHLLVSFLLLDTMEKI